MSSVIPVLLSKTKVDDVYLLDIKFNKESHPEVITSKVK